MEVKRKKYRQACVHHRKTNRPWEFYEFAFINDEGKEIWRCKECKEYWENWEYKYKVKKARKEQLDKIKTEVFWEKIRQRELRPKQELWDTYILDQLCKGIFLKGYLKGTYRELIEIDVIRLQRAIIKLERLINKKKGIKECR